MNISTVKEIGTELGFVLPQDIVEKLEINAGDQYSLRLNEEGSIVISLLDGSISNVRTEVLKAAKRIMKSNCETLEALKDR